MISRSLDPTLGIWSVFVFVPFFIRVFFSTSFFIRVFIDAFSLKIAELVIIHPKSPNCWFFAKNRQISLEIVKLALLCQRSPNWHFFTKSHQISLENAILAFFHWKLTNLTEYCQIATFLQSAGVSSMLMLNLVPIFLTILFH